MTEEHLSEDLARQVLTKAIDTKRCAELLECLFNGGSVTIDANTGELAFASAIQLAELMAGANPTRVHRLSDIEEAGE